VCLVRLRIWPRLPLTRVGPGLHRVGKGRLARLAQRPEEAFYRSCLRDTQASPRPPQGPMKRPEPVPAMLKEALTWTIPRPLVRLEARPTTVVSLTETPLHLLIHIVNYDLFADRERIEPEPNISLWICPPRPIDESKAERAMEGLLREAEGMDENDPRAMAAYEQGKQYYYTKRGQLNFSCADCHVKNAGMMIRADMLSPALGHPTHFPVYRSKWGDMGTLHRRFDGCNKQVRAEPLPAQGEDYRNLEYFLTYMSNGMETNGPGARK